MHCKNCEMVSNKRFAEENLIVILIWVSLKPMPCAAVCSVAKS
jgi:hypothetical protein